MTDSTRIKGAHWIPQKPAQQDQPENPLQTAYRQQREAHRQALAADKAHHSIFGETR